jgi:hypothetical protein
LKFSVLLPTRNRLELLKYAVQTVLQQDYDEWEIVVSDNCSEEDVRGYIEGLRDPRIHYFRTQSFVPVTDNWNLALARSTGNYVIMLGDDDALLHGYFRTMRSLIEAHDEPDFVYSDAVQFAYPGVVPGRARGFMQIGYAVFFDSRKLPFLMHKEEAIGLVRASMDIRLTYGFNMQHSLVSRSAVQRLSRAGDFFQSPYPDYYASNALFLESERILIVPQPLVAIGISPKSFGYFYVNERQSEGSAFLNNMSLEGVPAEIRDTLLPGSDLITAWFLAMYALERNFGARVGLAANRGRYRRLQILYLHQQEGRAALAQLRGRLSPVESARYWAWSALIGLAPVALRRRLFARAFHRTLAFPRFDPRIREVEFDNILQLVETIPAAYY